MSVLRGSGRLLWLTLTFASVLVVFLAHQNRVLKEELRELRLEASLPHAGLVVPAFAASTATGDSVRIGSPPSGSRQVLFILNSTCPYCEATLPLWNEIAASVRGSKPPGAEAYAITLDTPELTGPYLEDRGFTVPWVAFPDRKFARLYRASRVPLTVVVDEHGEVRYARVGVIDRRATVDSVLQAAGASSLGAFPPPEEAPAHSGPGLPP